MAWHSRQRDATLNYCQQTSRKQEVGLKFQVAFPLHTEGETKSKENDRDAGSRHTENGWLNEMDTEKE